MFRNACVVSGVVFLSMCVGCPPSDTQPPADVSQFTAQSLDSQVALTWVNPSDADFAGVKIQRKAGAYPASPTDGQTVYNGPGQAATDSGLANGVAYYYAAYAYDDAGNYASGANTTATPVSGAANADILLRFDGVSDDLDEAAELPPDEVEQLRDKLGGALQAYQAGDPCEAATLLGDYEALAQSFRQSAGANASRRAECEQFYNAGRLLRYDMVAGTSAKDMCEGQERVGAVAGAAVDNEQNDNVHLAASVTFGEPRPLTENQDGEVFTQLEIPGAEASSGEFGAPAIPYVVRLIAVPQGADVELDVVTEQAESFDVNVFPVQDHGIAAREDFDPVTPPEDLIVPMPAFVKDDAIYSRDAAFPSQVATAQFVGVNRGLRIFSLKIAAGQYNPAQQEMVLFKNVDVTATFTGGSGYFVDQAALGAFEKVPGLEAVINGSICLDYPDPRPIAYEDIGEEFLILTHPDFKEAADDLAIWRTQNGLFTKVHVVCDGAGPGEDTALDIRDYIFYRYHHMQIRLKYVLLLGDLSHIPPFYVGEGWGIHSAEVICTDWPYSKMTIQSGADTAEYWNMYIKNGGDMIADLRVGRVPAEIASDASSYVDASIDYEANPPVAQGYYERVTLASHFQCCRTSGPEGQEQMGSIGTMEKLRPVLTARGYQANRIYFETVDEGNPDATPPKPPYTGDITPRLMGWTGIPLPSDIGPDSGFNWAGSNTDVATAWKNGSFLIIHVDHGWPGGWWAPTFNANDVYSSLYGQVVDRPFVFSINCSSGMIDQDGVYNFTQKLFWSPGQVMGLIAATRNTYSDQNDTLLKGLMDALFPETIPSFGPSTPTYRLGDVFMHGMMAMIAQGSLLYSYMLRQVIVYQCYGDPTVAIHTAYPYDKTLSGTLGLDSSGDALVATYGLDGATLTVMAASPASGDMLPIGRGTVKNGVASINNIAAVPTGEDLHVAVEAPNAIPIQITAQVERTKNNQDPEKVAPQGVVFGNQPSFADER